MEWGMRGGMKKNEGEWRQWIWWGRKRAFWGLQPELTIPECVRHMKTVRTPRSFPPLYYYDLIMLFPYYPQKKPQIKTTLNNKKLALKAAHVTHFPSFLKKILTCIFIPSFTVSHFPINAFTRPPSLCISSLLHASNF